MNWSKPISEDIVHTEWVDYNGHMNDAAYAIAFSKAVDKLMAAIGINKAFIDEQKYTIYTLETHLLYLQEALENQPLYINAHLIEHDEKRLHVLFTMKDDGGNKLATSEQMLMGIDQNTGRSAPFPNSIYDNIVAFNNYSKERDIPKEAGRSIGFSN